MSKLRSTVACAVLASVVVTSLTTRGDEVVLEASRDTTLFESTGGDLSNGAGDHFFVGRTNQIFGPSRRRALLYFDVGAAIPPDATIETVTLRLHMSKTVAGPQIVSLHRVLADWGEGDSHAPREEGEGAAAERGDATWIHRFFPETLWDNLGGDYRRAAPSASTNVIGIASYDWSSAAVITDVQEWVNNPETNFGWILVGNESQSTTAKRFDSHENSKRDQRPRLFVTFVPPLGVGACCFEDGSCQFELAGECEAMGGEFLGEGTSCFPRPCPIPFIRGDGDGDGVFNGLVDALFLLAFQFQNGPGPPCLEAGDADGDRVFNGLLDALYVLAHQFQGGPAPPPPYPVCRLDPNPQTSLGCASKPGCG